MDVAHFSLPTFFTAGLRREVLVLHALRPSGAAGEDSPIDAVARWLLHSQHTTHSQGAGLAPVTDSRLQLPAAAAEAATAADAATQPQAPSQLDAAAATQTLEPPLPDGAHSAAAASRTPLSRGTSAAACSALPTQPAPSPFPDATTAFIAAAHRHANGVGIVHLAMHVHGGGPVTAWEQRVESVTEPGVLPQMIISSALLQSFWSHAHCDPWPTADLHEQARATKAARNPNLMACLSAPFTSMENLLQVRRRRRCCGRLPRARQPAAWRTPLRAALWRRWVLTLLRCWGGSSSGWGVLPCPATCCCARGPPAC